jgi:Tfp pilus assembly protein PilN
MKAVNLLPDGARRSSLSVRSVGGSTAALFGALALGLVLVAGYVVLANGVTSRQDRLAELGRQQAAAEQQVAKLKPYADLEALRTSLLQQVRTLADDRYDWPKALDRLARAFPSDTTLSSFDGTKTDAGPTVSLKGCTPSHERVAVVIDRLRAVKGVNGVALQSSTLDPEGGACKEQFQLTVQLAKQATTAAAPATGAASPSTPAPTPTPTPTPAPTAPTASAAPAPGGTS